MRKCQPLNVSYYVFHSSYFTGTLKAIVDLCVEGASVKELCNKGDSLILEEAAKVYKKEKDLKKGIAFPTCLSVNNCVCHFSPTKNETDHLLKKNDVVKM